LFKLTPEPSQAIDGLPVIFATLAGYWIVDTVLVRRDGLNQTAPI
jgi:hypothetical protein